MITKQMSFGFVGAGKLGSNLIHWMGKSGWHIKGVYDLHKESAEFAAKITPTGVFENLETLAKRSDCLVLSLPDNAIIDVAERISEIKNPRVRYLIHTSGILSSNVLRSTGKEFSCVSMHPIMSVPNFDKNKNPFRNIHFGIEGMARAESLARTIVLQLGGKVIELKDTQKALYHAGCSIAANKSFGIFEIAREMLEASGINRDDAKLLVSDLVISALNNWKQNDMDGLTGPVKRNDFQTIQEHKTIIKSDVLWEKVYNVLQSSLVELLEKNSLVNSSNESE